MQTLLMASFLTHSTSSRAPDVLQTVIRYQPPCFVCDHQDLKQSSVLAVQEFLHTFSTPVTPPQSCQSDQEHL